MPPLFSLEEIVTKDAIPLSGLLHVPKRLRRGRPVLIWLSGLTGRLSDHPAGTKVLAEVLGREGIAFCVFDHRGYGVADTVEVPRGGRTRRKPIGTAFERFEESVFDIEAAVSFLRRRGFGKIFLLGHSTGANKAAYYIRKTDGRRLAGVILAGPISDIPGLRKNLGRNFSRTFALARKMVRMGRRDELLPTTLTAGGLWSAARFLSIASEGKPEDTFSYYDARRRFYWAKAVYLPVLIILGGADEHADRPVPEIFNRFRRELSARWFSGQIIPKGKHSFSNVALPFARAVLRWLKKDNT